MSFKSFRKSLALKQTEIAELLGLSQSRYSVIERSPSPVSLLTYSQLQALSEKSQLEVEEVVRIINDQRECEQNEA